MVPQSVLYPNPVVYKEPVTLRIGHVHAGDEVHVGLFTTAYRHLSQGVWTAEKEGVMDIPLDLSALKGGFPANGLYYVRLQTRWERRILKLLILR
jgi:hypothetical protein